MKITIDTDSPHAIIEKQGEPTTWRKLTYAERLKIINKVGNILQNLMERIAK